MADELGMYGGECTYGGGSREATKPPSGMTIADFHLLRVGDVLECVDPTCASVSMGTYVVVRRKEYMRGGAHVWVRPVKDVDRFLAADKHDPGIGLMAGRFAVVGRLTQDAGALYYDVLHALNGL